MKKILMSLALLGISTYALAESGPTFRERPTTVSVQTEKAFSIPLRALLATIGDGNLTWSTLDALPAWATLNQASQRLTGTPPSGSEGDHAFRLSVRDTQDRGDITNFILVSFSPNKRPVWNQSPVVLGKFSPSQTIQASLKPYVSDPENDPISFSITNGPSWVTLSSAGVLSGKPPAIGQYTVNVQAADAGGATPNTVEISVAITDQTDKIILDRSTKGAVSETLWVVDYSTGSYSLGRELKNCISNYYSKLDAAGIISRSVYVSADGSSSKGNPVKSSSGKILIDSSKPDASADFQDRMVSSFSNEFLSASPTFNASLALAQSTKLEAAGFLQKAVPLHIILFSDENDMFNAYQRKTAQAKWGSKEYTAFFQKVASDRQKPMRLFAVGPDSRNNTLPLSVVENMLKVLPPLNNGELFPAAKARGNVAAILKGLADYVIAEAAFSSKARIKLSKTPSDVSRIKVSLEGFDLVGNTGGPDDLWTFESSTNTVVMFWSRIELTEIPPNAVLEVTYPY